MRTASEEAFMPFMMADADDSEDAILRVCMQMSSSTSAINDTGGFLCVDPLSFCSAVE